MLTIFPMLYITSAYLIYFIDSSLYLLIPSPILPLPLLFKAFSLLHTINAATTD